MAAHQPNVVLLPTELVDLADDPRELRNLAAPASGYPPAHAGLERELHDRMLRWLVSTAHPLTSRDLRPGAHDGYRTAPTRPVPRD